MLNFISNPSVTKYICVNLDSVPEEAYPYVKAQLLENTGDSARNLFPEFAMAFPLTISAIEKYWPVNSKLVLTKSVSSKTWVPLIVFERDDLNLFFNPIFWGAETEGEIFEQDHAMLPDRWKELYRWFDSFSVREDSLGGFSTINTPLNYASRLSEIEYCKRFSVKKAELQSFAEHIDSNYLRCWMITESGDTLWIDEQRCEHRVYHIKNNNFKDFYVLPDSESKLDQYLSHYVSGGKPAEFDFRK